MIARSLRVSLVAGVLLATAATAAEQPRPKVMYQNAQKFYRRLRPGRGR
jgi:hypothetical protein